jgi:hypothetical protein
LGYGIPNFFFAYTFLLDASIIVTRDQQLYYTPKPIGKQLHIFVEREQVTPIRVQVYNKLMQEQYAVETTGKGTAIGEIRLPDLETYPQGVYFIKIIIDKQAPLWIEMVKE